MLLTSLPAFQRWGAGTVSQLLEKKIESKVSIGKLRLNMLGHVVLDDVKLYDQRDTLMLQASRIASKIDIIPLVEKKIRISGAQLIGAKAKLYKDGDEPYNFQFLVDAFSKKDTTESPLDLRIGALVIRRGDVRFNQWHVQDLSLTARVMIDTPDTLAIDLRNLSFREQSGFHLTHLSFEANAGKHTASVQDFLLKLSRTCLQANILSSNFNKKNPLQSIWEGCVSGSVCPRDLACFVPKFAMFDDIINLVTEAKLSDESLRMSDISVSDNDGNVSLLCDATVTSIQHSPNFYVNIRDLRTGPSFQQFLTQNLQGQAKDLSPILTRLGSTKSSGTIDYQNKNFRANLQTESEQGRVAVNATLYNMQDIKADVTATDVRLGHLLNLTDKARSTTASLETSISGTLPSKSKQAKLSLSGIVNSLTYKGYEHRNIPISLDIDGKTISGEVMMDEPNGLAMVGGQWRVAGGKRSLQCRMQIKDFAPHDMFLTERYEGERFTGNLEADFTDVNPNNLQGELRLTDLQFASEEKGTLRLGDAILTSDVTENGMHLRLQSEFLRILADGIIDWKALPASLILPVRQNLPSLFPAESKHNSLSQHGSHANKASNDFRFFVQVLDTLFVERLLDADIRLSDKSIFEGTVSDAIGQIALQLHVPRLQIGNHQFQNIFCRTETSNTALQTSLQGERIVKGKPVEISLDAYATDNKVSSRLRWDNKLDVAYTGDIKLTGLIRRDLSDQRAIDALMNESHVVIGDTLWRIKPATIRYHDKVVDVDNLSISQADRHINIGGRISSLASDTLRAELADIDISYIMDLVNFHKVDFDGRVTGSIYATSLMKKPFADAFLQVKDFTFNQADLGNMDLYANWGKQERAILLEADMRGPIPLHRTNLHGTIIPGKGAEDGLNLNIQTSHFDLSFLRKFTKNIFSNLEGRTSGWARVFGPFKKVNLEGDMFINEMKMHVLALGTDYHLAGDSVIMRPDNIWIRDAHAYDNVGTPGISEHQATVNVHLMHDAFKDLSYDIGINAHNFLCYKFPYQGTMSFFGTVYADAKVALKGEIGTMDIDVAATPMPGTVIEYNAATPGTVTEAGFVTYGPLQSSPTTEEGVPVPSPSREAERALPDIRINFDIDVNPNAKIRILMDPRSGDNISLFGNGHLLANYYNKGRFQLFGTYRVSDGTYNMSIRDLIRKEFTFLPDGTIVFGGDAMQAALNLKAKHTVPNVSLDELSPSGLGLSNTRVDCLMHIGGIAKNPAISFDFDIPNANEDEKQMVRSMLNTDEERDMQAIYLLGVGRFYTYGTLADNRQTKSSKAVNSVLSSTLSSRFNQIMSQALGGSNWSFGTNLRTGEEGWQELDAEALVSGKMLSGRLQFNGNFGYRENKYKMNNNNFIGDFDIQYRLSPRSPFSLKAYNQTNDRYFTQSSLTTQGVGIKFQRDFSRFQELFQRTKRKERKNKGKSEAITRGLLQRGCKQEPTWGRSPCRGT